VRYSVIDVRQSPLDNQCLEITLFLDPSPWQRWWHGIPRGRHAFRGFGASWYQAPDYNPVPPRLARLLSDISADRAFRHLQQAALKKNYRIDPASEA
jgi:hypothetical protein